MEDYIDRCIELKEQREKRRQIITKTCKNNKVEIYDGIKLYNETKHPELAHDQLLPFVFIAGVLATFLYKMTHPAIVGILVIITGVLASLDLFFLKDTVEVGTLSVDGYTITISAKSERDIPLIRRIGKGLEGFFREEGLYVKIKLYSNKKEI